MVFNIYYESLEQGLFYLEHNLKKIDANFKINLIKKRKQSLSKNGFKAAYSKAISNILVRKNPDLIVSCILNDIEYPLMVLEFSTASFTKDHEQQRADNFLIPIKNNCIYVKISPINKKGNNHGGDISYNYIEPFALCYQKYDEIVFHINWEAEEGKKQLKKHPIYKSLPSTSEHLLELLRLSIYAIQQAGILSWKTVLFEAVSKNALFSPWVCALKKYKAFEDIKKLDSTRTKFSPYHNLLHKENVFTLKINRMGHAMDPERGMLVYYDTFLKDANMTIVSKFVFDKDSPRWYKATPKEAQIKKIIGRVETVDRYYLIVFLVKGLSIINGEELVALVKSSDSNVVNIDAYLHKYYPFINNSFRTIVDHSSFLQLSDGKQHNVFLTWSKINFEFNFDTLENNTKLQVRKRISEDDVTFLTVHELFKTNNITPLSVSYPGAQSDMPILPEKEKGRQQKRIYIDNIGVKKEYLILQENKGRYAKSKIKEDIDKISLFKSNKTYCQAVVDFMGEYELKTKKLVIGVGFGESATMSKTFNEIGLDKIDYFLIIDEAIQKWKLYSNVSDDVFSIKKGTITLPKTFEVPDSKLNKPSHNLFNFNK